MNDTIEAERALARFDSTFGMELDGSVKSKGITFFTSRKVPPGFAWVMDKDAMGKYTLCRSRRRARRRGATATRWRTGTRSSSRSTSRTPTCGRTAG
jgi:hypothetical protein